MTTLTSAGSGSGAPTDSLNCTVVSTYVAAKTADNPSASAVRSRSTSPTNGWRQSRRRSAASPHSVHQLLYCPIARRSCDRALPLAGAEARTSLLDRTWGTQVCGGFVPPGLRSRYRPRVAVGLERFEFVAHAFVAATGPHAGDGWTWLTDLWARLGSAFGIAQPIAGSKADLPPRAPEADGVVAARTASAPGVHQAVVRRVGDVVCLSVVRAPTAGGPRWDTFDAEWSTVLPTPTAGVLGVARILQAQLDDPAQPVDAAALGPAVAGMLTVAGRLVEPGDRARRGVVGALRRVGGERARRRG